MSGITGPVPFEVKPETMAPPGMFFTDGTTKTRRAHHRIDALRDQPGALRRAPVVARRTTTIEGETPCLYR